LGRRAARQRLRRATHESLTVPVFDSPVDCTPWVIGGLWPAELSMIEVERHGRGHNDIRVIAGDINVTGFSHSEPVSRSPKMLTLGKYVRPLILGGS